MYAAGTTRRSLIAGLGAAACAPVVFRATAGAAQFEFKCGSELAVDHPNVIRMTQMWNEVERDSGGRLKVQFFPGGQLGGIAAMFTQARVGALQFLLINSGSLSSVVPTADIGSLGFAYKDQDEALRVMDGPVRESIRQEASTKGIYITRRIWGGGLYQIGSNPRPIRTPDDLTGFRIRVAQSKIAVDLFKTLGASPTPLSYAEVYTALQTKIIDGLASPLVSIEASKFYEVEKYVSLTNHAWSGDSLIASNDVWKSLPSDLQDIVEKNNTKYALLERQDAKGLNATLLAKLKSRGMTMNEVDQTPFRARLRQYFQSWASEFGPTLWGQLETSLGRKLA